MKKLEGYDLVTEAGEVRRLPAGIYKLKIKEVIDVPEREYLDFHFDIADGEYKGYYSGSSRGYGNLIRSYKKTGDEKRDNAILGFFKACITAIEKTNPGYQWNWDESTLANKCVIGVFGEEEYLQDNEVRTSVRCVEFRSLQAFNEGKIKVPELKKLPEDQRPIVATEVVETPTTLEDDKLPW